MEPHELELIRRSARGLRRVAGMRDARRRDEPSEDTRQVWDKTEHGELHAVGAA